jgi:hypothetical protein
MEARKRISLILAITLVASLLTIIATTLGRARDNPPGVMRVKVLRRKDQLHIKPRPEEIAAYQEGQRERKLKTREFKDMPLAIQQVRNLQSDTWPKDLEIEVKNISSKPIYCILAYVQFPDYKVGDGVSGIVSVFGERKYIDVKRVADSQDPHVDPGKTVILTIPEQYRKGLQVKHERSPESMKRLEMHFGVISFGDGTGFEVEHLRDYRVKDSHSETKKTHHSNRLGISPSVRSPPQDGCGPCSRYVINPVPFQLCYGRILDDEGRRGTCNTSRATTSPDRPCTLTRPQPFDCDGDGIDECNDDEIYDSSSCPGTTPTPEPSPSPSPSPTTSPSPSPSPTCDPSKKPNPSNCSCEGNGQGGVDWACGCPDGSDGADYIHISTNYGCPPNKYNVNDCCLCIDQNHTCPSGCHWDTSYCRCVDFLGAPCSAATPIPNTNLQPGGSGSGSGDPSKSGSCTEYWWVYSESYDGGATWHELWSTPAGCW